MSNIGLDRLGFFYFVGKRGCPDLSRIRQVVVLMYALGVALLQGMALGNC